MTTIISLYPPDQRGRAIGLYVGMLGLAVGFGPVVGGITVDALGWRWIFFVSLPFIGLALTLGALFMPEDDRTAEKKPFDWWGYGLLCIALLSLMSAIAGGHREGWWSDLILSYWLIGVAATVAFIASQHYRETRLLDFSLFPDPRFAAAIALAVVFGIGNFGIAYAIPVFGQLVLNLTPTAAGLLLLPAGIISSIATVLVGRMVDRMSPFILIMVGIGMGFAGTYALSAGDANTPIMTLLVFGIACRLGQSFMGPSITASAIRALPPEAITQGSGTISFFRQMGGAFGINCLVAAVEMRTSFHHHSLGTTQHGANRATGEFLSDVRSLLQPTGIPDPVADQVALKFLESSVAAQSDALAWRDGFLLLACIFILAVLPAWLLGRAQRAKAY